MTFSQLVDQISGSIRGWWNSPIESDLSAISQQIKKMEAKLMSQVDDLNAKEDANAASVDAVVAGLTKLGTDLSKTLADLAAQIKAGSTPTDLTATLAKAQSITDKLAPLANQLSTLDTEVTGADAPPTPAA